MSYSARLEELAYQEFVRAIARFLPDSFYYECSRSDEMSQELVPHEEHAASALHAALLESHPDALRHLSFSQAQQLIQILVAIVPQIIAIFKTPSSPTS